MGCISSTKKLSELRNENIFRVRVAHLHSVVDSPLMRNGFLELSPRELVFITPGHEPIVWALQHLRRYGSNGDVFSFEAGRRCMTGPGVYTFRCQQAEQLYHLFQRYINAVSLVTEESRVFSERDHPSHSLGRADVTMHTNNYLEPLAWGGLRAPLHESISSSPLSLDSPDSVPSLSFTNEVVHFQNHQHPSTPGVYVNTNTPSRKSNVYEEHPLRLQTEHNNNDSNASTEHVSSGIKHTSSRKSLFKRSSLDMPPIERAPILTSPSETLHMYANVDSALLNADVVRDREKLMNSSERCYENLSLLLQNTPSRSSAQREVTAPLANACEQQPTPPPISRGVNYIVLDLDQPRSPTYCSPKTCLASGFLLSGDETECFEVEDCGSRGSAFESPAATSMITTICDAPQTATNLTTTSTPATIISTKGKQDEDKSAQEKNETSLGYSTIDFIKTCALIKSSTHGTDFDTEHDQEESSRITRHSKFLRKAYSISE